MFGSLFAGIGGIDLGFERAGLRCEWQVEIDDYRRRVLSKHWPDVRRWEDVKTFPPSEGDWSVDVIAGGFPCQDISLAGKGEGIDGERSGLWSEFIRVIRVLRPRFVVVENVSALLVRGIDRVLGDLAESGFDAEWQCLPAVAFGAPHIRDRVFIVADSKSVGRSERSRVSEDESEAGSRGSESSGGGETLADSYRQRFTFGTELHGDSEAGEQTSRRSDAGRLRDDVSDAGLELLEEREEGDGWRGTTLEPCGFGSAWAVEPNVGRVAHGIPYRVDRLRGLGNAVVPIVAEWIGRRIVKAVNV